jgi:hypothetical protein
MNAMAMTQAATMSGQLLWIVIGSAAGPQGIVPPLSIWGVHINADVPPKVDAAAEIRIKIAPLGFREPATHIKIPPAK